jgi:hypothetical protein
MIVAAYPEWTEYQKKNGLDPLGMQNTSVALYQILLPGISNVTLRICYYGLYAWLSSVYAKQIGDTNPKAWQRFVRRAEALYALIAQHRGGEAGVAGVLWAQAKLRAADANEIAFADDAEPGSPTHYLKQAWGAYGAAYASQLFEIGIFSEAREHLIPVPSPEIGEALAACFEAECGPLGGLYINTIERGAVTLEELVAFALLTPSGIRVDSEERQIYEELLFAGRGLERPPDLDRRKTLLLILELARQLGRIPDVGDLRWACYAGCLSDDTPLTFTGELDAQRERWRAYQANDLSHICFETLLKFVLDALEAHPGGIALVRLIGDAVAEIVAVAKTPPDSWAMFLDLTPPAPNACSAKSLVAERTLTENVIRTAARQENKCTPEAAWMALQLLAILHNRVRSGSNYIAELGSFRDGAFRSILTEVQFLEDRLHAPFQETVAQLVEERVVQRHLWIALRKLRYQGDYTFLIEPDEGRVRLRDKDGPVFTNPRFAPAITFLKDVHLLGPGGLTPLGMCRVGTAAA